MQRLLQKMSKGSTPFVLPSAFVILLFVGFPFVYAVWMSLTSHVVGSSTSAFIGLQNYVDWFRRPDYWRTLLNTLIYASSTVLLGIIFGLAIGLSLHKIRFLRDLWGGAILVPWIIPTVVSVLIWGWIFNPVASVLNYILRELSIITKDINWLGGYPLVFICVIGVSAWRYTPYFGVVILAARKQVEDQLYEAALIDGANGFQQFLNVTLPSISRVILLTSTLIFVRVVSDFSVVYVLTRGGPSGATQILTVLSFTVAFDVGRMGSGIAVPLSVMPVLVPLILVVTGLMVKNLVAAR
jgi:multiple sugar transport system permease protein